MYPNNLSGEYPCQGDTWRLHGVDFLTVTGVTPSGVIYYMKGIRNGNYSKTKTTLAAFKDDLARYGLGIPDYCTSKYYTNYGCF
jgi:hypothetical protein